jgi:alkylhydroperoxidase family enzyme
MPVITVPAGTRPLSRADELAPELRDAMKELRRLTLDGTSLSMTEIEAIRLRSAQLNGCRTCFGYRIERDDPERGARASGRLTQAFYDAVLGDGDIATLTEREQILRELTERYSLDHFSLDEDERFWARMRASFTDAEIVEAGITIMSFVMSARFNRVLGLDGDACELPSTAARILEASAAR